MSVITFSVISGLISLLLFGIGNALVKIPCQKITAQHFVVYKSLITSAFFFTILLFTYKNQNFDILQIIYAALLGILGLLAMSLFYKAIEIGKVGLITPIASSTLIYTIIFTSLLYNISVTYQQGLSILLILVGIVLVKIDFKELRKIFSHDNIPGLKQALLHTITMGVYMSLIQLPNKVLGPILYPFIGEFSMAILGLAYLKLRGEKLAKLSGKALFAGLAAGLLISVGILVLFNGIKNGNPLIVFPIYYASPPLAALVGYFLYKERLKPQQYFATAIVICGVILLKISST